MLDISATRRAKRQSVELNIAPLIDMVFILLIFFLVTTSFVRETGVEVNRPSAQTAQNLTSSTILIGVTRDNLIFMDKRNIAMDAVRAHVERVLLENPESNVVVVADRDSKTGVAVAVVDQARAAGAKNVSVAATSKDL